MAHWITLVFTRNAACSPHIPLGALYKKNPKRMVVFFLLLTHYMLLWELRYCFQLSKRKCQG